MPQLPSPGLQGRASQPQLPRHGCCPEHVGCPAASPRSTPDAGSPHPRKACRPCPCHPSSGAESQARGLGAFLLGVCGLRAGSALRSVESISNPQSVSKGDRPEWVPYPWPASPSCMCRAPARPTPRSRDGGKTPSSQPLDEVHNFSPELNRPGEPGLTFQASEATARPPRYSPQRGQPHASGSPTCVALVSTPTTLTTPDPHIIPLCHRLDVRLWWSLCSIWEGWGSVGGGAAQSGSQLPLPVPTHSLKHFLAPAT